MSCDKLPRVGLDDASNQGLGDYWWKRHNVVVELLHEREDILRWACHFIHQKETGHIVIKTKKVWECEECSLDLRAVDLDGILSACQTSYHYPGDKDGCEV